MAGDPGRKQAQPHSLHQRLRQGWGQTQLWHVITAVHAQHKVLAPDTGHRKECQRLWLRSLILEVGTTQPPPVRGWVLGSDRSLKQSQDHYFTLEKTEPQRSKGLVQVYSRAKTPDMPTEPQLFGGEHRWGVWAQHAALALGAPSY